MTKGTDRIIAEARALEQRLRQQGKAFEADCIGRLCRSNSALVANNAALFRAKTDLTKQIEDMTHG